MRAVASPGYSDQSGRLTGVMPGACWANGQDGLLSRSQPLGSSMDIKRSPSFHKWARPAYEGALPTLSTLPGEVVIKVFPGDKMYQVMEIEPDFMRPVILHGFGTRAKKRLTRSWFPRAAASPIIDVGCCFGDTRFGQAFACSIKYVRHTVVLGCLIIQSRSLSGRHVSTGFLDSVLGAMMKQVCWHSRRSKAYRGLPEARMAGATVEETAFEDVNMWQAPVSQKPPLMGT